MAIQGLGLKESDPLGTLDHYLSDLDQTSNQSPSFRTKRLPHDSADNIQLGSCFARALDSLSRFRRRVSARPFPVQEIGVTLSCYEVEASSEWTSLMLRSE